MENIGYYYYRQYFKGYRPDRKKAFEQELKKKNKELTQIQMGEGVARYFAQTSSESLYAVTQYPGLFTGSGMGHEIGGVDGELKLGFYFDYTTGIPVIPGSSVKGTLRSVFTEVEYIHRFITGQTDEKTYPKVEIKNADRERVTLIEKEIFDGMLGSKPFSIYDRDIFFDADVFEPDGQQKIMGIDSITPHVHDDADYSLSMLKSPTPLLFLKVLPEVQFRFQFRLKDHRHLDHRLLSVDEKLKMFKYILETVGIGAKTNVGYGQFKTVSSEERVPKVVENPPSREKRPKIPILKGKTNPPEEVVTTNSPKKLVKKNQGK